jgi:hypothetical protein
MHHRVAAALREGFKRAITGIAMPRCVTYKFPPKVEAEYGVEAVFWE